VPLEGSRPCLTRQQLSDWSSFSLPREPAPLLEEGASLRVPGLSYERIRLLDRYGMFDDCDFQYVTAARTDPRRERLQLRLAVPYQSARDAEAAVAKMIAVDGRAWFPVWRPRPRSGDTRLYTGFDLLVARLAALWLHAGLTMHQIVLLLRGNYPLVPFIHSGRDLDRMAVVVYAGPRGAVRAMLLPEHDRPNYEPLMASAGEASWWVPLRWLGRSGFMPKLRKALAAPVQRWNQTLKPAELVARQGDEARQRIEQRAAAASRRHREAVRE